MMAARASVSAFLTRASVSFSSALSMLASAPASRDLNTACAASKRRPGSFAISVSEPSAASSMPRRRLLSRTLSSVGGRRRHRLAGRGVGQLVGLVLDENLLCRSPNRAGADP